MKRKRFLVVVVVVAIVFAVTAGKAFAWSGSTWTPNTCGADLSTPSVESGPWWVQVKDESGNVLLSTTIPGTKKYTGLSVGFNEVDAGLHTVTFSVANAANHSDGLVTYTADYLNCHAAGTPGPAGPQGPAGPTGPAGISYGCNGMPVVDGLAPTCAGATGPQGAPGTPGKDGATGPAGPKGDTGPAGPAGQTGPQGPRGPRGKRGARGPAGRCKCGEMRRKHLALTP